MNDQTTAFLAFALLFAGIALYLARLAVASRRLEKRVQHLESTTGKGKKGPGEGGMQ